MKFESKYSKKAFMKMIESAICKFSTILPQHQWVNSRGLNSLRPSDWGRVTHICVGKLTIIGSDNGLLPGRHQAIIWTNAGILLTEPLGTNFSEILIGIQIFSFMNMRLKMSSVKWRPFCLGLNVLMCIKLFCGLWEAVGIQDPMC